jgi:hypothetical protein
MLKRQLTYSWQGAGGLNSGYEFVCGHCGAHTSASLSWVAQTSRLNEAGDPVETIGPSYIHVCSACKRPSFFDAGSKTTVPGTRVGASLKRLPPAVASLWDEARDCMSARAYTAAAMLARKLLMNLAVHEGAKADLKFFEYVEYLVSNGYVPPKGKNWVTRIKDKGNEANHEIRQVLEPEAREVIELTELLLRFNYELSDPSASPP